MIKKIITLLIFVFVATPVAAQVMLDADNAFIPPEGKILLMVGQDKITTDNYVKDVGVIPSGVMVYASIQEVSGLTEAFNNGAGIHHADYLMRKYPNSTLQLGLYMAYALKLVNNGVYDSNIEKLANWISNLGRPVYLRIGYECDDPTNHYDPTQYKLAFRRIVRRFRELGVENVAFVFHSGSYLRDENTMSWYPGDEYVDWIAVSLFSPNQFGKIKELAQIAAQKKKPLMIAESSPSGTVSSRAKLDWFKKYFYIIETVKPQAVCYINCNWDKFPTFKDHGFGDARIQVIPELKQMWLEEIKKEKYLHADQIEWKNKEESEKAVP